MRKKITWIMLLCASLCFTSSGTMYAAVSGSDSTGWKTDAATDNHVLTGNNIHTTADFANMSSGLYATNSSDITLNNGSVTTEGAQAHGLYAVFSSTGTMNGGYITTTGEMSNGATITDEAFGYLYDVDISTSKRLAYGVLIGVKAHGHLTGVEITTSGEEAYGIEVDGRSGETSKATLTMIRGSIETLNSSTYTGSSLGSVGININHNAEVTLTDVDITTNGIGSNAGNAAHGVVLKGVSGYSSKLTMSGGSILTNGNNSSAFMFNGANMADVSGVLATTKGNDAYGAYIYGTGANAKVSLDISASDISTSGIGAHGLYMLGNGGASMSGGSIKTIGSGAYGAYATGDYHAPGSTSVVSLDNVSITTGGDTSHGVYSRSSNNSSSYAYLEDITVTTSGSNSHAVYSIRGDIRMRGASLTADDSLNSYAVYADGTSSTLGLVAGEEALYNIKGAIVAGDYGSMDITMGDGSILTGRTSITATNSTLDLTINGANALWDLTQNSALSGLTLDGSTVNFNHTNVMGTKITATTLNSGAGLTGGNFTMKADIVSETADNLIISGSTDGAHYITVLADATAATTGSEITTLVQTADQNGSFSLSTGTVDSGAWTYSLRQAQNVNNSVNAAGTGANWQLYASGATNPGSDSVNTFYAAYLLGYAETNTLIQRLGDLRQTPDESGLWFRGYGGKFESNAKSYVQPFDMSYWGVQLGYDRKINIGWDGDAYFGVMFGYSKGDLDYLSTGSGEVDSKMAGIYGTFVQSNGFYLDAILKYQWMDNEFNSLDSSGAIVTGSDVSTGGLGFSVEVGQRIPFGRKNTKGWYAEPQMQFTYQRYSDGYFTASNGLHIGLDGFTSMIGRLGVLIGYETENSNLYGKLFRAHEFDGEVVIVANGQPIADDFGGSWWVYGLGYTARLNNRNSIYLEIERTSGGSFQQTWAVKGGWRTIF